MNTNSEYNAFWDIVSNPETARPSDIIRCYACNKPERNCECPRCPGCSELPDHCYCDPN